jgi:UDP-N-acetylmuramate dehydrogenase
MEIQENISLAPLTTLRLGGRARFYVDALNEGDLREALEYGRKQVLKIAVIGGGSNLIVPDDGFDGLVIRAGCGQAIHTEHEDGGYLLRADAGVGWDAFVRDTCELGLWGVECLAGIPGLTGASPVQNIGAYGQEVASTIRTVRALDRTTLEFVELSVAECGFAYRHSIFNSSARGKYVITRVDFFLAADSKPNLSYADLATLRDRDVKPLEVYSLVRLVRSAKGMLLNAKSADTDFLSVGSFFRNPVVPAEQVVRIGAKAGEGVRVPQWPLASGEVKLAAAWLVEQAGFAKGFTLGQVGISHLHALALVNRSGNASAADLFALRDAIMDGVERKFGVRLEQEPMLLA